MSVTLAEVAKRAGVSGATASRVLNGRRYVSAKARQRVELAAQELDYVPHHAARELSLARTSTIALLVHHAQYPAAGVGSFSSRVVHGITRGLRAAGHDLLYVVVDDEEAGRLGALPAIHRGRSDGALILGPAFPPESIAALHAAGRPMVLVDNWLGEVPVDAVLADNQPAFERMTTHLGVDHGYGRIVCLAGPPRWPSTAERVAGYVAAMTAIGRRPEVLHAPETTLRDGATLADSLVDNPPEAIVAVNDAMAIGALQRLQAGPRRPAVVGFDDITWARLTDPPLSTVSVDAEAVGALAAEVLVARIAGEEGPPRVYRIPAAVRLRASCGCQGRTTDQDWVRHR